MTYREKLEGLQKIADGKRNIQIALYEKMMKEPLTPALVNAYEKATNELAEAVGDCGKLVYKMGTTGAKPDDKYP